MTCQNTDVYLLVLALSRGGRFVTFDRANPLEAVASTGAANLVIF